MPKLASLVEYLIWVGLLFLGVEALQYIEWLGCPRDAFICGSTSSPRTWVGLTRAILLVVCLVYPLKIALYFVTRNRLLRRSFDDQYRRFDLGKTALRAALVAVPALLAIYLLTFEKVWASSKTISVQEYIWSAPIKRSWGDVVAVSTWCKPGGRGAWDEGYELTFRDRGKVDLASNAGPIAKRKPAIFSALHGLRFDFDDSAVDENCLTDFREMATQRP
jgi:hypothetical protein